MDFQSLLAQRLSKRDAVASWPGARTIEALPSVVRPETERGRPQRDYSDRATYGGSEPEPRAVEVDQLAAPIAPKAVPRPKVQSRSCSPGNSSPPARQSSPGSPVTWLEDHLYYSVSHRSSARTSESRRLHRSGEPDFKTPELEGS